MKVNEGTLDRIIRLVVGIILLALVFVGPHTPWGWLGLIAIGKGLVGFCPFYKLLGINTCKVSSR